LIGSIKSVMLALAASAAARSRFLMKTVSAAGRCSGGTVPVMQWIARPPIATT
jgi:hypothetical protein